MLAQPCQTEAILQLYSTQDPYGATVVNASHSNQIKAYYDGTLVFPCLNLPSTSNTPRLTVQLSPCPPRSTPASRNVLVGPQVRHGDVITRSPRLLGGTIKPTYNDYSNSLEALPCALKGQSFVNYWTGFQLTFFVHTMNTVVKRTRSVPPW